MTSRPEASGLPERERARALMSALPASARATLALGPSDLRAAAEHLLYTAMRQPAFDTTPPAMVRAVGRIGGAVVSARKNRRASPQTVHRVTVFVTRGVHVDLYAPVAQILSGSGIASVLVDAETRHRAEPPIEQADVRLADLLDRRLAPRLVVHAVAVHGRLRRVPPSWVSRVGPKEARRLLEILRRGLPLAALELARVQAVLGAVRPNVAICFSESGVLARTVPAAAALGGIPTLDLPHAEAADPGGVAGAGYDGFAVYGPRSRHTLEAAGIPPDRILEIGPLRYDALLARPPTPPAEEPRRVLFASQPSDPRKPATHPDVKRGALTAAQAATAALAPAELVVIPHPTEPAGEAERFVADLERIGPPVAVERERGLHDLLPGTWLLVTASSQSVFEAVLSGVPAITVNPTSMPDPVTFAAEGIAIGVRSAEEATAAAVALLVPGARDGAVARARASLGGRIGPLDGRAAERAAAWIQSFVAGTAGGGRRATRG